MPRQPKKRWDPLSIRYRNPIPTQPPEDVAQVELLVERVGHVDEEDDEY